MLSVRPTVAPEHTIATKRRICLNATAVKGGYVNVAVKLRFTCQNFIGLIDDHATVFQNTTSMRKTPYDAIICRMVVVCQVIHWNHDFVFKLFLDY